MKRRFKVEKLVRDRTPERAVQKGARCCFRVLDDTAFCAALRDKIIEEAREVAETADRKALCSELADLYEAADSLAKSHDISSAEVEATRFEKNRERGGFDQRIYATYYEVDDPSEMLNYVLQNPEKYPEIA